MPRDYAAEYQARLARHPTDTYKARGHGSARKERIEKNLRTMVKNTGVREDPSGRIITRGYEGGKSPETKGLVKRYGEQRLDDEIKLQRQAQKAYERGDRERARSLWASRDTGLPQWMWWYHGVFG